MRGFLIVLAACSLAAVGLPAKAQTDPSLHGPRPGPQTAVFGQCSGVAPAETTCRVEFPNPGGRLRVYASACDEAGACSALSGRIVHALTGHSEFGPGTMTGHRDFIFGYDAQPHRDEAFHWFLPKTFTLDVTVGPPHLEIEDGPDEPLPFGPSGAWHVWIGRA